jgi:penicillin amidase
MPLAKLEAARQSVAHVGVDTRAIRGKGSNNWIVGPSLTASGHTIVANDTHLLLSNPAIFYLVHIVVQSKTQPIRLMGVQFPGIPGITLGMNSHVAWGSTVSYIDVTDVYEETIVPCGAQGSGSCVVFKDGKVPLVPRVETIGIGHPGAVTRSVDVVLYDVPHHGPILPTLGTDHAPAALGAKELSVRYTGHEPAGLFRALMGVMRAENADDAVRALEKDFKYGNQNWVIGDDQGNYEWTQALRVPTRAPGFPPYKVLPGDGRAEWGPDLDMAFVPHAKNPASGFIATANNDPLGVTDDGDPFNEPTVNSVPLYLGAYYDSGTRVGRITKRIEAETKTGGKLSLDDMQAIQADAVTEYGEMLAPTLIDAASALLETLVDPKSHPELASLVAGLSRGRADTNALLTTVLTRLQAWTFDTPSGVEGEATETQIADSQATAVFSAWLRQFDEHALGDEVTTLGIDPGSYFRLRLTTTMATHPEVLATPRAPETGDPVLFDDLRTPDVVESKRTIAAVALLDALDELTKGMGTPDVHAWRWGTIHTVAFDFLAPLDPLRIPLKTDPVYANGFPRHGNVGTVDVGDFSGRAFGNFTYDSGAAIRFVCDLGPDGPTARNIIPGGETADPASPHYKDLAELWRKNQTILLPFKDSDVFESARAEFARHGTARVRFQGTP